MQRATVLYGMLGDVKHMQRVPQMQMQVQIYNANCKCKLKLHHHPTGPRGRRKFSAHHPPQKLSNNNYIYTVVIGSGPALSAAASLSVVKSNSKNCITLSGGMGFFQVRGASQHLQPRRNGGGTQPIAANPLVAGRGNCQGDLSEL
jgi:hypothetical protein